MDENVPTPQSISEVEDLVKRLYQPGPPKLVNFIQAKLQELQRSSEGWQLADELLASHDVHVRFFGALTFTVKLNSDWGNLDSADALRVRSRLVSWFVRLVTKGEGPLVVKKLCSTLVTYFLRPSAPWTQCIRHLICAFCQGDYVQEEDMQQCPPTADLLRDLRPPQLIALLWFSSTLAEDIRKVDSNSIREHKYHERFQANIDDLVALLAHAFEAVARGILDSELSLEVSEQDAKILEAAFACWSQWVFYAQTIWSTTPKLHQLQSFIGPALQCCLIKDQDFAEDVVVGMGDLLTLFGTFFQRDQLNLISAMLRGPAGRAKMADPDAPNFVSFGRLLLAFGDAALQDLVSSLHEPATQEIMAMLHQLVRMPGNAADDDEIVVFAVEFWLSFAEYSLDNITMTAGAPTAQSEAVKQHEMQAMLDFWGKIRYPPPEVADAMDAESRQTFQSFRTDVKDLYQSSYSTLGTALLEKFAELLQDSLLHQAWLHVEASLWSLTAFAEVLDEEDPGNEIIARTFDSSLFADLSAMSHEVPIKVQRAAVEFLGHYSDFFEQHTDILPAALNFLFSTLKDPSLSNAAARSISSLCSSCRSSLTAELDTFFRQYDDFLTWPTADMRTRDRVFGAISAIAQALDSDLKKAEAATRLLRYIEIDISMSVRNDTWAGGTAEGIKFNSLVAMTCMVSMGKSFQAPDDVAIDLESDLRKPNFWNEGKGKAVQDEIIRLLQAVAWMLITDGDVLELMFAVLKTGYTETSPGPFVLPAQATIDLYRQTKITTPQLETVLSTVAVFLNSHLKGSTKLSDQEARSLLEHTISLRDALGDPADDPVTAQGCVEVFECFIKSYLPILLQKGFQDIDKVFSFSIQCMQGPDVLPQQQSASFWATFIPFTPDTPGTRAVMLHYGPRLCHALVRKIGGEAARSELDAICEPLKSLIGRTPEAKGWIEAALNDPSFPSTRVTEVQKRKFLQQIML